MPGAGKSVVADYFTEKGFRFIRFGQIVLDEVKRRGLEPTEANERAIREAIRNEHGMAAMAKLNLPKFKTLLSQSNVIADGLYSFAEYKLLKQEFQDKVVVVAVYAPPKLRHERISRRVMPKDDVDLRHRPRTMEEAEKRDYAELENLDKGPTIAMADYTILNTKDMDFFKKQITEVYKEILKEIT